jgi:hypothetical protein
MTNITSANASLSFVVANIGLAQAFMQGFSVDEMFSAEAVDVCETMMGVDGYLSGGWIPAIRKLEVTLMADSPSNVFFDAWAQANDSTKTPNTAQGILTIPAINMSYTLITGFLKSYKTLPDGKKVLQPRKYGLEFQSIIPVPIG